MDVYPVFMAMKYYVWPMRKTTEESRIIDGEKIKLMLSEQGVLSVSMDAYISYMRKIHCTN